jgi:hypothetical protein
VASLALSSLTACPSLPFLRRDPDLIENPDRNTNVAEIASRFDRLDDMESIGSAFGAVDDALSSGHVSETQRTQLMAIRGEALLDMAVLADVLVDANPISAEGLYLTVARQALRVDDASPDDTAVIAAIVSDLRAGDWDERDVLFARSLLDAAFSPDDDESWYGSEVRRSRIGAHARLMALSRAMRRFGAWARRGTGSGGDALARDCGFLCDASQAPQGIVERAEAAGYRCADSEGEPIFDESLTDYAQPQPGWAPWELLRRCGPVHAILPRAPQSPLLLSEANWLDAVLMTNLLALQQAVEVDRAAFERVTVSADLFLASVAERMANLAIPQELTANVFFGDLRLDLPRARETTTVSEMDILAQEPRLRMLFVRSEGVFLALRPHLQFVQDPTGSANMMVYAEAEAGYHLPGQQILQFERPGAIAGADLLIPEDGTLPTVPSVHVALLALETAVTAMPWVDFADRSAPNALSVLVDGDTYFSSLEPVVLTAVADGYDPVVFHTWNETRQELTALPMRLVQQFSGSGLVLTVREDGYVLQQADGSGTPLLVSRVNAGSLRTLHDAALSEVAANPGVTLSIQVDDGTADFGILANLVSALAYYRVLDDVTTDRGLLEAAVEFAEGAPRLLFPQGILLGSPR